MNEKKKRLKVEVIRH